MQYKLRPYQETCVQKGIEVLTSKKPCMSIIVAPTAAGKSIIISELAKRLNDFVVVLQPNKELLEKENIKSILVFCPSVQEAKDLSARIKNSKVVWGDMNSEERSKTLTQFNNQEFNVLINCEMLQIGYDNPNLEAIIMATPTNSVALYYQILGRCLRIKEGKEKAIVLDLVGNTDRFGRVEDFSFEHQDYAGGWAMFSDQKVLSNFPLGGKIFPTRNSLKKSMGEIYSGNGTKINFGKYKGSTVDGVLKKDKGYLIWLINNQEFNWGNNIGVRNEIYKLLNLELPQTEVKIPQEKLTQREILEKHIPKQEDLKDIW